MAAWKIAPALAAGNCTVMKPASPTPWSILKLAEVIEDVVPAGVINIVNGSGASRQGAGSNKRIAKVAFTGETVTGWLIMGYAAQNLIPSTTELGGKSPNIFFEDIIDADDALLDKAIEGLVLYAFNKGEVCTCPSRALIQESIYDHFMERCLERIGSIRQGNPLDPATRSDHRFSGAAREDRELRADRPGRGRRAADRRPAPRVGRRTRGGYYFEPTVLKGDNSMRVFQEEIFGPVLAVTTFKDEAEALRSPTTRCTALARVSGPATAAAHSAWAARSRPGACGPTATTSTPRGAAFGGYKSSGVGRENHRMMLEHYSQTKCLLVSYDPDALGFF